MDPSIVTFRHEYALAGWRQCIVVAAEDLKGIPELKGADEALLELAKARCENMAVDFRKTVPDYLMLFARKKGLNRSGQEELAKAMLDDYLNNIEASLTLTGEAAPGE